ncbi:hypothetical protein, partial [Pseudomonas syringae]|uniref:hypothetical protein n=1 Tax=Pseudomonas syringae TaxID=317 RepID=UPI001F41090F
MQLESLQKRERRIEWSFFDPENRKRKARRAAKSRERRAEAKAVSYLHLRGHETHRLNSYVAFFLQKKNILLFTCPTCSGETTPLFTVLSQ